jgi:ubiquinone/menaquinone biosynthesis C-methylase UbiE
MESETVVAIYESRFWRRSPLVAAVTRLSFEEEYRVIVRAAEVERAESLLDLACGTGIYARPLSQMLVDGIVVGLDLSLPMLRYASRRASKEAFNNVLFVHADALDLPFASDSFDVVNYCGALHLFADLPRALGEVSRVLKRGGRFTVAAYRRREGCWAERIVSFRQRLTGMDAFHPHDLTLRFGKAGLEGAQCHHAAGIWLIMSARKPMAAN